jgi:hypothetical protein
MEPLKRSEPPVKAREANFGALQFPPDGKLASMLYALQSLQRDRTFQKMLRKPTKNFSAWGTPKAEQLRVSEYYQVFPLGDSLQIGGVNVTGAQTRGLPSRALACTSETPELRRGQNQQSRHATDCRDG